MVNQKTIEKIVIALFFPVAVAGAFAGNYVGNNLDCVVAYMRSVECSAYRQEARQRYNNKFFRKYDLDHDGKISREEYLSVSK